MSGAPTTNPMTPTPGSENSQRPLHSRNRTNFAAMSEDSELKDIDEGQIDPCAPSEAFAVLKNVKSTSKFGRTVESILLLLSIDCTHEFKSTDSLSGTRIAIHHDKRMKFHEVEDLSLHIVALFLARF